jgi:hypothetical protein
MSAVLAERVDVFDDEPCLLCPLAARCRRRFEACEQFASFVSYGGRRWRKEARKPSTEIYARIWQT